MSIEYELFTDFRDSLMKYIPSFKVLSEYISEIDIPLWICKNCDRKRLLKPVIYNMGEEEGIN
jgi:DNA mismatch repair ATPase MutS